MTASGWVTVQVVGRPFRFARIARIVRYMDGLSKVSATIVAALPVTLQVPLPARLH